jgi:Flp pilus assembly protein TadG
MRRKANSQRGQAVVELAFQIPLMLLLLFGGFQIARIFYTYHTLQKALRGAAGFVARSTNVNYCDIGDATLAAARNFVVFGNLQASGTPVVPGLTPDLIQILPERDVAGSTGVTQCPCTVGTEDTESCDVSSSGRAPDFVVVNLGSGFPLTVPFPFVNLGTINLKVSVRMPVTGG